jgi:hypothetical protein
VRVDLVTTFSANKKEPLSVLLERIHAAFLTSGLGEPAIQFSLSDAPAPGSTSSVDRVLKRYPQLQRFESTGSAIPASPAVRQISNGKSSPTAVEAVECSTLLAIAAGVPRSFPFHNLSVQFSPPASGLSDENCENFIVFPATAI